MIEIGTTMTLELVSRNDKEVERYRCKLVDKKDDMIYIDYPVNEKTGRTGIFLDGTQFKATFVGKDESVYIFDTEVKQRKKLNIPVLVLDFPGKESMIRIQRREYVRIETAVDAAVHIPKGFLPPFTTITTDISGGGAAVILPVRHHLKEEMILEVWFVIPLSSGDYKYVKSEARIVRVIKGKDSQRDKVSLQFININENDRQSIIRFCFERQLSMRRKGMR